MVAPTDAFNAKRREWLERQLAEAKAKVEAIEQAIAWLDGVTEGEERP